VNPTVHSEKFHIAADHPALPGHFPGNPVAPGVVLLDRVAAAIERIWGQRIGSFPQVKFQRTLGPDQVAELFIERDGAGGRFRFVSGTDIVASGAFELGGGP
jgi:3-hydroxyacyl-[acyl-carrier-protein] dehydratase